MKRLSMDEKRERVMIKRQKLVSRLRKFFSKYLEDIGSDIIDFEGLCDSELSFSENVAELSQYIITTKSITASYQEYKIDQRRLKQDQTQKENSTDDVLADDW